MRVLGDAPAAAEDSIEGHEINMIASFQGRVIELSPSLAVPIIASTSQTHV
jgi:hypothetical protein